jgi:hypothetical protein
MKTRTKWIILTVVVIAVGSFVLIELHRSAPVQNFSAKIERGDINDVVEAMLNRILAFGISLGVKEEDTTASCCQYLAVWNQHNLRPDQISVKFGHS